MLTTKHSLCGTESKYLLEQLIALPSVGNVYKKLLTRGNEYFQQFQCFNVHFSIQ